MSKEPLTPTHTLDGKPLVQQEDKTGRTYFIDPVTRIRAATAGKTPEPIIAEPVADIVEAPIDSASRSAASLVADLPAWPPRRTAEEVSTELESRESAVLGTAMRAPTDDEMDALREAIREAHDDAEYIEVSDEPAPDPELPSSLSFDVFSVVMSAMLAGNGHAERMRVVAWRKGPRTCQVSLPQAGGSHNTFIAELPEEFPIIARLRE